MRQSIQGTSMSMRTASGANVAAVQWPRRRAGERMFEASTNFQMRRGFGKVSDRKRGGEAGDCAIGRIGGCQSTVEITDCTLRCVGPRRGRAALEDQTLSNRSRCGKLYQNDNTSLSPHPDLLSNSPPLFLEQAHKLRPHPSLSLSSAHTHPVLLLALSLARSYSVRLGVLLHEHVGVRNVLERLIHAHALTLVDEELGLVPEVREVLELVVLVAHLLPLRPLLEQLCHVSVGHFAGEVDEVLLGDHVPPVEHHEERELRDRNLLEHRPHVLLPQLLLCVLVRCEVPVRHRRVVVVRHVVVLPEIVIGALHDARAVHAGNVLLVLVELDESVQRKVDEREEEGHGEERLEVEEHHEPRCRPARAPSSEEASRCNGRHDEPVPQHAPKELVEVSGHRLVSRSHPLEDLQTLIPRHVAESGPVQVQHEVRERSSVKVPLVERVALPSVQTVVQVNVRS
mmetsp:Transcript_10725/g.25327  ORF Transcript_10725/g.25327 Transcript_10725/m.25327 type:complete len:456 (-) Transcript_10725:757-2124(-)